MVLGIIAVLMGIVTTAASESIRGARSRKADALCNIVQAGFAAYYAQFDEWPGSIGQMIEGGSLGTRQNAEGGNGNTDPEKFILNMKENDDCIREMVLKTKEGIPMMDVSGLYVSKDEGRFGQKCRGLDFMQAATIKGMSEAKSKLRGVTGGKRLTVANMHFGYPDPDTGNFRHFVIVYSIPTDSFSVRKMPSEAEVASDKTGILRRRVNYYDQ